MWWHLYFSKRATPICLSHSTCSVYNATDTPTGKSCSLPLSLGGCLWRSLPTQCSRLLGQGCRKNITPIWGSLSGSSSTQWPRWNHEWMFSRGSQETQALTAKQHEQAFMLFQPRLWVCWLRPQTWWSRNHLSPVALSEFLVHMGNNKWSLFLSWYISE